MSASVLHISACIAKRWVLLSAISLILFIIICAIIDIVIYRGVQVNNGRARDLSHLWRTGAARWQMIRRLTLVTKSRIRGFHADRVMVPGFRNDAADALDQSWAFWC